MTLSRVILFNSVRAATPQFGLARSCYDVTDATELEVAMHRAIFAVLTCAAVVLAAAAAPTAQTEPTTVLYQNRVVELERTLPDPNDLWVLPQDLPRINDFELKPEGACLAELCVPVRQDRDSEMFVTRARQGWFNVTELARRLQQAFVVDHEHSVWSFGNIPVTRNAFLRLGDGARFRAPQSGGQAGAPVRLQGEEGPDRHLGLLVRVPL